MTDTSPEAVERFRCKATRTPEGYRGTMDQAVGGNWVRYSDYAALAAVQQVADNAVNEAMNWMSKAEDLEAALAIAREALGEIASHDTGATAGVAFTAKAALALIERK